MSLVRLGSIGATLVIALGVLWFLTQGTSAIGLDAASTRKMAERLIELADKSDPQRNVFLNQQRVAMLQEKIKNTNDRAEKLRTQIPLGNEQTLSGDPESAIATLKDVQKTLSQPGVRAGAETMLAVHRFLGTAYFRLGEQENCLNRHTVDSCLIPIRGGGVHALPRGSRASINEWMAILKENPRDIRALWLLNLAHMTLNEYPDGVPKPFRIPASTFESSVPFPRFYDVAVQAGLAKVGLAGGCVVDDLDGDGYLDVMSSSWGQCDQIRFFLNHRDGKFTDRTEAAGLMGEVGGLNLSHGDYNNDGHLDVLVLRGAWLQDQGRLPNSLLKNNGDGTFEDVTEAAGLLSFHPTQVGAWGDFDNDGWLDLFIGNEGQMDQVHACELYHNNRDGTFTNVAKSVGLAVTGFVKGATWGDYNNDGRPDLYVSRMGEPNLLFRNDGPARDGAAAADWKFTDVSETAGVAEPMRSFSTWFWDFDNDGWLDLFVADYSLSTATTDSVSDVVPDLLGLPNNGERSRLFRNKGDGRFADVTREAGLYKVMLVMGSNFGDLDNDGWLDMYLGTGDPDFTTLVPNRMFRSNDGRAFQEVTYAGGFGHLQKGHGVAFADLDNDGDQDVYEVMGGAYSGDLFASLLFENPGFGNNWITLRLEGVRSNKAAIGARIKLSLETPRGPRDVYATVSTGSSFGSASLQQELGLGDATAIKEIRIDWPASSIVQIFQNVQMNQFVRIREDGDKLIPVELLTYDLSPAGHEGGDCPFHSTAAPSSSG